MKKIETQGDAIIFLAELQTAILNKAGKNATFSFEFSLNEKTNEFSLGRKDGFYISDATNGHSLNFNGQTIEEVTQKLADFLSDAGKINIYHVMTDRKFYTGFCYQDGWVIEHAKMNYDGLGKPSSHKD